METPPVKRRRQSEEKGAIQSIDNILYHDVMIVVASYLELFELFLLKGVANNRKANVLMACVSTLIEEAPYLDLEDVPIRMCVKYCKNAKKIDFWGFPLAAHRAFEISRATQLLIRQNHSSITAVHRANEVYFNHSHAFGFMNLTYLDIGHFGERNDQYIYRYLLHNNFPNLQTLHLKIDIGPMSHMAPYCNFVENELPKFKSLTTLSLRTLGPLQNFTHLKSLAVAGGNVRALRKLSNTFPNVFENFANLDSLALEGCYDVDVCKMFGKCRALKTLHVGGQVISYLSLYTILQNNAGTLEDLELFYKHVSELPHDFRLPNVKRLRFHWRGKSIDLDRMCFLFPNLEIFAMGCFAMDFQDDFFVTLAKNGWSLKEIDFCWCPNEILLPKIILTLLDENVFPDLEILVLPRGIGWNVHNLLLAKSIRDILKKRKHCIVKNACGWKELVEM